MGIDFPSTSILPASPFDNLFTALTVVCEANPALPLETLIVSSSSAFSPAWP